jgi:hypothetical protein
MAAAMKAMKSMKAMKAMRAKTAMKKTKIFEKTWKANSIGWYNFWSLQKLVWKRGIVTETWLLTARDPAKKVMKAMKAMKTMKTMKATKHKK